MSDNKRALKPDGTYAMVGDSMSRAFELLFLNFWSSMTVDGMKFCLVAEGPDKKLVDLKGLVKPANWCPLSIGSID